MMVGLVWARGRTDRVGFASFPKSLSPKLFRRLRMGRGGNSKSRQTPAGGPGLGTASPSEMSAPCPALLTSRYGCKRATA